MLIDDCCLLFVVAVVVAAVVVVVLLLLAAVLGAVVGRGAPPLRLHPRAACQQPRTAWCARCPQEAFHPASCSVKKSTMGSCSPCLPLAGRSTAQSTSTLGTVLVTRCAPQKWTVQRSAPSHFHHACPLS